MEKETHPEGVADVLGYATGQVVLHLLRRRRHEALRRRHTQLGVCPPAHRRSRGLVRQCQCPLVVSNEELRPRPAQCHKEGWLSWESRL